ncbi:hypothetical protein MMC18_006551, partial [Xylographa bjoerkii]|nr:hypothetical protein [Xylographa bjoerkii]
PSLPASTRVLNILKQVSAHASEGATEDQASDHSQQNKVQRSEFELNVTEEPPTSDQLRTILEYVGARKVKDVIDGAKNESDAMRLLKEDSKRFRRPVIVDWNNVIGDNESEILKMVGELPKGETV